MDWDPKVTMELATRISDYELGELSGEEEVELFQCLVDSGVVWHLQGSYQREAIRLLEAGEISLSED